jgi:nucleoside-diphosphate-sugar epimerase
VKIFVTGVIGRRLVPLLRRAGDDVTGLVLTPLFGSPGEMLARSLRISNRQEMVTLGKSTRG